MTKGYKKYRELRGEVDLSFLDKLPWQLKVTKGLGAMPAHLNERFGKYLEECISTGLPLDADAYLDAMFKREDGKYEFPINNVVSDSKEKFIESVRQLRYSNY